MCSAPPSQEWTLLLVELSSTSMHEKGSAERGKNLFEDKKEGAIMEISDDLLNAILAYRKTFGKDPTVAVFAPGRVNLIGEYTDFNDGFVMPFALPHRTIIVGSKSDSPYSRSSIFSANIDGPTAGPISFGIGDGEGKPDWANYVIGTAFQYKDDLPSGAAFNACISSNVPLGSGLSSSAALEVATATFIEHLFGITTVSKTEKALRCQKAEHDFAHCPCGIMDQFISALGDTGNLLLIDCRSQVGTLVPFGGGAESPVVVVTNSMVKHSLSGSEYPDRVKQCKSAVATLQKKFPHVTALRDATMAMLDDVKDELESELIYVRARHVISENDRTVAAAEALKRGDFKTVGHLMLESHDSLSADFEVSCRELDILKELAIEVPGVYGSRMTGGGFGGCTVTLLAPRAVPALKKYVGLRYKEATKLDCVFFEVTPSSGAGVLALPSDSEIDAAIAARASSTITNGSTPSKGMETPTLSEASPQPVVSSPGPAGVSTTPCTPTGTSPLLDQAAAIDQAESKFSPLPKSADGQADGEPSEMTTAAKASYPKPPSASNNIAANATLAALAAVAVIAVYRIFAHK